MRERERDRESEWDTSVACTCKLILLCHVLAFLNAIRSEYVAILDEGHRCSNKFSDTEEIPGRVLTSCNAKSFWNSSIQFLDSWISVVQVYQRKSLQRQAWRKLLGKPDGRSGHSLVMTRTLFRTLSWSNSKLTSKASFLLLTINNLAFRHLQIVIVAWMLPLSDLLRLTDTVLSLILAVNPSNATTDLSIVYGPVHKAEYLCAQCVE